MKNSEKVIVSSLSIGDHFLWKNWDGQEELFRRVSLISDIKLNGNLIPNKVVIVINEQGNYITFLKYNEMVKPVKTKLIVEN